jgi:hypothetical protein
MQTNQNQQANAGRQTSQQSSKGAFAIDDLKYDIVTLLHKKSKALEAYDKYFSDAQGNQEVLSLLQDMRQRDLQDAERLERCLEELLASGSDEQDSESSRSH